MSPPTAIEPRSFRERRTTKGASEDPGHLSTSNRAHDRGGHQVDLADEDIVALELDEYVATDHILDSLEVLDAYQETILKPSEVTNVWVSGFFGSGKSSYAKVLGYLLANPTILGRPAAERFAERVDSPRISALLNTIHDQAPTLAVFVDLSTGRNVAREGECRPSCLPSAPRAPRVLRNLILAELEFDLESDGVLEEFERHFASVTERSWVERRNVGLAKEKRATPCTCSGRRRTQRWTRGLVSDGARDQCQLVCGEGEGTRCSSR